MWAIGMIVAAFDFDGTVTRKDTMFPFLRNIAGPGKFAARMAAAAPTLCRYALGRIDNQAAKEDLLIRFLRGLARCEIERFGDEFAQGGVPGMLRKDAVEKARWHMAQGHYCVLLSASLDVYVGRWARQFGFHDVACSRLQYDSNELATGYLDGRNCYGPEKVRRLRQLVAERTVSSIYAYGDSRGDKELLAMADRPSYRLFSG